MEKSDIDSENKDKALSSASSPNSNSILKKIIDEPEPLSTAKQIAPGEIIIGNLTDIDAEGKALVNYPGEIAQDVSALSTVEISHKHIGRQVALLFANGDPTKPVIMGLIHSPLQEMLENFEITPAELADEISESSSEDSHEDTHIDGKRIVLEGKEEIVLKCGDASITLTREGKIVIRGKYLLNRSSGVNRIMGSSVQVN